MRGDPVRAGAIGGEQAGCVAHAVRLAAKAAAAAVSASLTIGCTNERARAAREQIGRPQHVGGTARHDHDASAGERRRVTQRQSRVRAPRPPAPAARSQRRGAPCGRARFGQPCPPPTPVRAWPPQPLDDPARPQAQPSAHAGRTDCRRSPRDRTGTAPRPHAAPSLLRTTAALRLRSAARTCNSLPANSSSAAKPRDAASGMRRPVARRPRAAPAASRSDARDRQKPRRCRVEPLRIIDQQCQRRALGQAGHEPVQPVQHRQPCDRCRLGPPGWSSNTGAANRAAPSQTLARRRPSPRPRATRVPPRTRTPSPARRHALATPSSPRSRAACRKHRAAMSCRSRRALRPAQATDQCRQPRPRRR